MRQYLSLMREVREHGTRKEDRTGTGTKSVFGHQMRFELSHGFPMVTTKKLQLKSIIYELQGEEFNRLRFGIGNNFSAGISIFRTAKSFSGAEPTNLACQVVRSASVIVARSAP